MTAGPVRQVGDRRAARADRGRARDRHRRLDRRGVRKDPAKIKACASTRCARSTWVRRTRSIGDLPTRQSLFASLPKFQDPYFAQLKEYLVHGQARPGVPIYPEISNQIQIMMGEVLSGAKSPEQALDGCLGPAVNDAYKKVAGSCRGRGPARDRARRRPISSQGTHDREGDRRGTAPAAAARDARG